MERTIYRLEQATYHDRDFLYRLLKATMEQYYIATFGRWDERTEQRYFQESLREWPYHLIIHNEQRIGCLSFTQDQHEMFLNEIHILPHYQNRGIGTCVLQDLIKLSQSHKIPMKLEVLKVNENAQQLYRRLDFILCGETDTHYRMVRACRQHRHIT